MVGENISQQDSELSVKDKVYLFWEISILLMPCQEKFLELISLAFEDK